MHPPLTLYRVYVIGPDDTIHDERFVFAKHEDDAFATGAGPDLSKLADTLDFGWTIETAYDLLERRGADFFDQLVDYIREKSPAPGVTFKPFPPSAFPELDDMYPVPSDAELEKQYGPSCAACGEPDCPGIHPGDVADS